MLGSGRLVVCGVGLIGGSLAAAVRDHVTGGVIGVDADDAAIAGAEARGLIDGRGWPEDLSPEDLVLVAVPTLAVAGVIEQLWDAESGILAGGAVVTDAASVKRPVIDAAMAVCGRIPANLVPGHPIAGSERSGVSAARADLFRDHRVILTPTSEAAPAAVDRVRVLWERAGAEVCTMDVAEHDRVLALTSHLPHLLAFALVDTLGRAPEHEAVFRFAAGGFRDFTRIASSDPVMWSDIFTANAVAVGASLDRLEAELAELRGLLEAGDRDGLRELFARAKALRDAHVAGAGAPSHD
ncbi:MAG: prephenate dehydrogenase/arogenate dehydrogenase family protein [Gammaproteobacteria bacterium]|nr:MAG: prephenate dehydrogenase/arogenate dehydrogenase family protein [Gammaproteobacteria bacterium]